MGISKMDRIPLIGALMLLCLVLVSGVSFSSPQSPPKVFALRGQVVAVNTKETPDILVIRVTTKKGKEMIIGAMVPEHIGMTRSGTAVPFKRVAVGDTVELTFVMTKDGAEAREIHLLGKEKP